MELRKANRQRLADYPENWKDIPGYEGLYAAFYKGAVLNRLTGHVLANTTFKCGYVYVNLIKDGRKRNERLHRLIALTFLPNPDGKPEVNHITGIKADNHAALLEWATTSENKLHAYREGLNPGSRPQLGRFNELSPVARPVDQYDLAGNFIKHWPSIAEAERNGFQTANICKVASGERNHHRGYKWVYSNL